MIKYNQTVNNLENLEIELPKITGYKKQFSIELPRGEEETVEEETTEAPIEQIIETPIETPVETLVETPTIPQTVKPAKGTITFNSGVKVGNMREVLNKFAEAGINVHVTSGERLPGQAGKAGKRSHHITGNAVDIVPGKGETWESMRKKIKENEPLKNWLRSKKIGIIDETVADTMKKTGATGPHWHIGPDKWALKDFETIFAKFGVKLPKFQIGGAFSDFDFNNIYGNSSDKIKALQRELGIKDDGIIGKQTISAIQKKVGAKVDGIWGKNSTAAAKQYVLQSKVSQPKQLMAPVSSTYVRKPIVPEMRLATDNEVVPAAGMEELPDYTVVFPENWNGKPNLLKTIHDSYLDYSNNEKWKRTVSAGTDSTTSVKNRRTGKMEEVPEVNMNWKINKDQIARAIALLPELNPNSAPEYTGIKYNDTWDSGSYRQKNETGITRLLRRSGNSTLEKAATSLEQPGRGTLGGFSYRTTPEGIEISDGYQFAQPSGGYIERSEHTSGYNEERKNMADNYRATHQKYFIPWSAYENIRKNYL